MKRLYLVAMFALCACTTTPPDVRVLDSCIFADEFDAHRDAWTAIPAPDSARRLLALAAPQGNPRTLYWFRADDGRVSACQLHRYGSDFILYTSVGTEAHVLDQGGAIVLVH